MGRPIPEKEGEREGEATRRRVCPLCAGIGVVLLDCAHGREFFSCETPGGCGLVFVPREFHPSAEQARSRYLLHRNDPADPGYRHFLDRLVTPLAARLSPGSTGLDFGCGPGPALSPMMAERGFPTRNHDPFFAPDPALFEERYAFITCTEVAEHFSDPRASFLRIASLIRPGGWFGLMTSPGPEDRPLREWWYVRDPTHVSLFRERTFSWLASWLGWTMERIRTDVVLYRTPEGPAPRSGPGGPAPPTGGYE